MNSHGLPHWVLNPARLPVPPPRLIFHGVTVKIKVLPEGQVLIYYPIAFKQKINPPALKAVWIDKVIPKNLSLPKYLDYVVPSIIARKKVVSPLAITPTTTPIKAYKT